MNKIIYVACYFIFILFFLPRSAFASTLYLSPGGGSIPIGGTTSVAVRLNTQGESVNAVAAFLSYPQDKVEVAWVSGGGAFTIEAEKSYGGGIIKISRGNINGVSGNVSVATIGFRGKAQGKATVAFIGGSAAPRASDSSDSLNLGASAGGVYNVVAGLPEQTKKPSASASPGSKVEQLLISDVTVASVSTNSAEVSWKTNSVADSLVEYGLEKDNYFLTASNAQAVTEHTIKLENAFLTAGLKLHFRARSKDAEGHEASSEDQLLQLRGYQVKIKVVDEEDNPLSGIEVLLYSDPQKAITDTNGEAVFDNVSPGKHLAAVKTLDGDKSIEIQVVAAPTSVSNSATIKVDKATVKLSPKSIIKAVLILGAIVALALIVIGIAILKSGKKQTPPGKIFLVSIALVLGINTLVFAQTSGDLALGKPVISVSSTAADSNPANAVDGNPSTAWVSNNGGAQWLGVDLGATTYIGTVVVKWGENTATSYAIELSDDGIDFAPVLAELNGDFNSALGRSGRYILIRTNSGSNPAQYQLAGLEVYTAPPPTPIPTSTLTPTLTPTPTPMPTSTPIPFDPGDLNRDRKIDLKDLSVIMSNFNKTQNLPQEADFNSDNKIDKADYDALVKLLIDNQIAHPKK